MATINTRDAKGIVTKAIADAYKERAKATSFLRSFFPTKEYAAAEISIEVVRGTERIAVDVVPGDLGNLNKFTRSTERIYKPPAYREYFIVSALEGYDALFGQSEYISDTQMTVFVESAVDRLMELVAMIERAYELQCAQVLQTGIVQLKNNANIDFKRKSGSMVDKSGATWAAGTNDPRAHLIEAGDWLRANGKVQGGNLNVIMGSSAYNAMINNAAFKDVADIRRMSFDELREPQRMATGQSLHGSVSAGAYNFTVFTYPEIYEDATGTQQNYIDPKKIIVIPENPRFQLSFAGIPFVDGDGDNAVAGVRKGAYQIGKYVEKRGATIDYDVQSSGIAIPVAVDQIYTAQVLA